MPRAPQLPETLRYLQPFRRKFARVTPENLNDTSGPPVLMPLLYKRIHTLPLHEAAALLERDRTALEQWLAQLGDHADPLHFVQGVFITASAAELVALIKEEIEKPPAPTVHVHMDLPNGAKLRRVPGADESEKLITLKGVWLIVRALPEEATKDLSPVADFAPYIIQRSEASVSFGLVTGIKYLFVLEGWHTPHKRIVYALTVPGGHVQVSITPIGKKVNDEQWDEAPFEACFHTLRVETKPPHPP